MKIMLIFFFVSPLPYLPQLQREPGIYLKQAYILGRRLFVKTIICCWCKLSILPVVLKVWENVHFLSTISISTTTSKGVISIGVVLTVLTYSLNSVLLLLLYFKEKKGDDKHFQVATVTHLLTPVKIYKQNWVISRLSGK